MSTPTPGSDPNYPQGGAPQGQPAWGAPQQPAPDYGVQGYGAQGYGAPGAPAGYGGGAPGQRPGMVTAAGIIGIVWGSLGVLFGLVGLAFAFAVGAVYGLVLLISLAISGALVFGGIQVMQGKSPKLLLMLSYVAIGVNVLFMIIAVAQGGSVFSGLLGFIIPGVLVFLLLQPPSKQYYASRGIQY